MCRLLVPAGCVDGVREVCCVQAVGPCWLFWWQRRSAVWVGTRELWQMNKVLTDLARLEEVWNLKKICLPWKSYGIFLISVESVEILK